MVFLTLREQPTHPPQKKPNYVIPDILARYSRLAGREAGIQIEGPCFSFLLIIIHGHRTLGVDVTPRIGEQIAIGRRGKEIQPN